MIMLAERMQNTATYILQRAFQQRVALELYLGYALCQASYGHATMAVDIKT
jgi:hypothetical protein